MITHLFLDFKWIIIISTEKCFVLKGLISVAQKKLSVDNYGITSAQTNQIMTTACVIVKLQPEQFNKSIKRNKLKTIFFHN